MTKYTRGEFIAEYGELNLIWGYEDITHVVVEGVKATVYADTEIFSVFSMAQCPSTGKWVLHGKYKMYKHTGDYKHRTSYYVMGTLHREDGPALRAVFNNNMIEHMYYNMGELHREGAPAHIIMRSNGEIIEEKYYINGECHREDGPAVTLFYGDKISKQWYHHGEPYEPNLTKRALCQ
tara:strand:- start:222 stop:758 length:537 start_codon:yes stop_codon:yes gene_type:complete